MIGYGFDFKPRLRRDQALCAGDGEIVEWVHGSRKLRCVVDRPQLNSARAAIEPISMLPDLAPFVSVRNQLPYTLVALE